MDFRPRARRKTLRPVVGSLKGAAVARGIEDADAGVTRNIHDVVLAALSEAGTERADAAEFIVAGDPGMRQLVAKGVDHGGGDLPRLLEPDARRDMALRSPLGIVAPLLGQVELVVDERVPLRRRVARVDGDLAVLLLAEPATPPPSNVHVALAASP